MALVSHSDSQVANIFSPLSRSLPLPLSVCVRVRGKPQGLSAASSLKALFHFQDRAGLQYGHCLYTNVALGIMFISITILEGCGCGEGGVLSMSALIAFHEIMPLQECLEETAIFQTTFLQPAVKRQLPSSLALSPSGGTRSCYESRVRSSLTVHVN